MKKLLVIISLTLLSHSALAAYKHKETYVRPSKLSVNQMKNAATKLAKRDIGLKKHWQARLDAAKLKKAKLQEVGGNRPYYGDNGGMLKR